MTDFEQLSLFPAPAHEERAEGPRRYAWRTRGTPVGQGSKNAFIAGGRAVVVERNHGKLHHWRSAIAADARAVMGDDPLITGPVRITATFYIVPPASLPKRRKTWPIGRRSGDWDHYARALGDAITAVVIEDDCLIVDGRIRKEFASAENPPGVDVTVEEIEC